MTAVAAVPGLDPECAGRLAGVRRLFRQIGDLKRIRVAHAEGSSAERAFVRSWDALLAGQEPGRVAARECAAALAGATLAGLDAGVLCDVAGLDAEATAGVLRSALDETTAALAAATDDLVRRALPDLIASRQEPAVVPDFVARLCRQPRAGATAPGLPRVITEPPESHADHCWAVAVYGALIATDFGADPGDAFLLGMTHHLHAAYLPDAGFAGEVLLGGHLEPVVRRLTDRVVATLPRDLSDRLPALFALRDGATTPLGRAFNAADVLDRVLQVQHHARAAAFTAEQALEDLDLVHDGPVADFHADVLRAAQL